MEDLIQVMYARYRHIAQIGTETLPKGLNLSAGFPNLPRRCEYVVLESKTTSIIALVEQATLSQDAHAQRMAAILYRVCR